MWSKIRSFFSPKAAPLPPEVPTIEVSAHFADHVRLAIQLIGAETEPMETAEVMEMLMQHGIGRSDATEILLFLPTAFARAWLPRVAWRADYQDLLEDKRIIARRYDETPAYLIIAEVTQTYFADHPDPQVVMRIGGRSAEIHAINKLLLENPEFRPEDVKFTPVINLR
jgi:hypothetical protein